ncbi:MAG TPA: glutathionylspermidine synthase family protein [Xanthobacteraceae bacterium]|nr:glutathionylspermidine synthase family protein [Xanthobacteraceae bacterium]
MQRIACEERHDWREKAEAVGFLFHTMDGEPYWDESAYYGFALREIERDIEAPTAELDAMCRELVTRAVGEERIMRALQIPPSLWNFIAASFRRGDPSLYGRFDLSYDGRGHAKLLEYNADTPTSVFETAVFQWSWLEDAIARQIVLRNADQYNSLHERLIDRWRAIGQGRHVHLAGVTESSEDLGTLAYLEDTARQGGLTTTMLAIGDIGRNPQGQFVDRDDRVIALAFKLYPWEWMFREKFGASLAGASTRWVEPPWKAILSSKAILPLLWEMFPRHPNLLPAYFEADPDSTRLGKSFVRKPLYSREGANVEIVVGGEAIDADTGPYGAEGFIKQAVATLPRFDGNYAVLGSWVVDGVPCGLSVREDASPITRNTSRFLPHAIIE